MAPWRCKTLSRARRPWSAREGGALPALCGRGPAAAAGQHLAHRLEVEPHREVRSLGRHHDDADRGVGAHRLHGPGQVAPEVHTHGVAGFGAVQPHRGHRFLHLDAEHRRLEAGDVSHGTRLTPKSRNPRGPVEWMGCVARPRSRARSRERTHPAHLYRRGFRGRARAGLAASAPGRRVRGLRLDAAAQRERGGVALLAHRPPRSRSLRTGPGRRPAADGAGAARLAELAGATGSVAGSVLVHNGRAASPAPERKGSSSVRPPRWPRAPPCSVRCSRGATRWSASTTPSRPTRS